MRKIRKGDLVRVASGRDAGKEGKVLAVLPGGDRAIVEGLNLVKKHQRPTPRNPQGAGVVEISAPIPLSRLRPIDPKTKEAVRVGFRVEEDGTKVRVGRGRKASGEPLPEVRE